MGAETALEQVDSLVFAQTGRYLNDLQRCLLQHVWQGQKYWQIAQHLGYTEGHIKDVAADLWQLLSEVLRERVSKGTVRSALERHLGPNRLPQRFPLTGDWVARPEPAEPLSERGLGEGAPGGVVGRTAAVAELDGLIQQGHRALVIQGEGGLGKTTLAQHYLSHCSFDRVLELLMAQETADILPVERVVEEWLKQDFGVEPGREFGISLGRLKRQLSQFRVGILIDNLEPALDAQGCFVSQHRRYRELLRVLTDAQSQAVTLITSRDRLCEPGIRAVHYRLPGLDLAAWQQFCQQRQLAVSLATLRAMHSAYGGNAKAMEILCGLIQEDFAGDMVAYWQGQGQDFLSTVDLRNLVDSQVSRLQSLDPDAYRVFCRLSVYRYQAVPAVPVAGLVHLMADLPPERCRPILASLRNRSLVECCKDQYWLHPVVRSHAIARLRASPDWVWANRQAAHFWTQQVQRITTLDEALQALEAYYHWVAIADYAAAARVILHSRDNQWQQFLPLGSTLYRMGLIQPVLEAITAILKHLPQDNPDVSELYNILGDLYWITGQIHSAISCQESAIEIAQDCWAVVSQSESDAHRLYYLTMLTVDSRLSLGLYALDLWDLGTAANRLQQVIDQATGTAHHRWAGKATVCLSLVRAYQGHTAAAKHLADAIRETVQQGDQTGRFAFFMQLLGQTYSQLGDLALAETLFQAAIAAAETGHYIQVKANALSGLGKLARCRGDWPQAIDYQHCAIALLEDLGAQCDLAEAHYQLGLTYQAMGSGRETQPFQAAIRLFAEIQAPLQVQKVKQAAGLWENRGP
ncbi:MAG: NB-ARC domain-containing protein [Cyanobacteria bacterium Co-bin13]|nr:NB-ARC domain-containing protein [Cyanobacteria bacterium Co-bin13]